MPDGEINPFTGAEQKSRLVTGPVNSLKSRQKAALVVFSTNVRLTVSVVTVGGSTITGVTETIKMVVSQTPLASQATKQNWSMP